MKIILSMILQVKWAQQQVVKKRSKRDLITHTSRTKAGNVVFNDVEWPEMWYLVSSYSATHLSNRSFLISLYGLCKVQFFLRKAISSRELKSIASNIFYYKWLNLGLI